MHTYTDLVNIIRRLRAPDGCPWDKVQTAKSLKTSIIEEAYELAEEIDLQDTAKIKEECGDVLLQGVFVAAVARDCGFDFDEFDIVDGICEKLLSRHTHIFGSDKAENEEQALKFWELAKAKEKNQKSTGDKLASVPTTFSALMRANKVQKIVAKAGERLPSGGQAAGEIAERAQTFISAPTEEAAGAILFDVVNLIRQGGIDPEVALTGAVDRFLKKAPYSEGSPAEGSP